MDIISKDLAERQIRSGKTPAVKPGIQTALYFSSPGNLSLIEEEIPIPAPGQVLVKSIYSAISAGSEMMVYRGQFPMGVNCDTTIQSLQGEFGFPMKYGYAIVGEIIGIGSNVENHWLGRMVFAFHPHQAYFVADPDSILPLPPDLSLDDALFFANMETAVSLVMDGHPLAGERVIVFGQGIVGLLTTALLSRFPLDNLLSVDPSPNRRNVSLRMGASRAVAPTELDDLLLKAPRSSFDRQTDLFFELSGDARALMQAVSLAPYDSRIIIGSWYKKGTIDHAFDISFHRGHILIRASQVSVIPPEYRGRWDKARRYDFTWRMLRKIRPSYLISHRFHINNAQNAYRLLDENAEQALQIVLTY